ncbi:unnamed protein product [Lactuca saligna]|uniref:Uncharacterized protein n=1 Tax=Lactuca saligna TaxID=75948 RepID=A0AA35ZH51_LACSI|nr:unnamed protein product [Lactuca saligna]
MILKSFPSPTFLPLMKLENTIFLRYPSLSIRILPFFSLSGTEEQDGKGEEAFKISGAPLLRFIYFSDSTSHRSVGIDLGIIAPGEEVYTLKNQRKDVLFNHDMDWDKDNNNRCILRTWRVMA